MHAKSNADYEASCIAALKLPLRRTRGRYNNLQKNTAFCNRGMLYF